MILIPEKNKRNRVKYIASPVKLWDEWEKWTVLDIGSITTYYISTYGRIYSTTSDRLLKGGMQGGHIVIDYTVEEFSNAPTPLRKDNAAGRKKRTTLQRLVALTFLEKPSPQHDLVIHLDRVKSHNWVDNLRWVKGKDLMDHSRTSPVWKTCGTQHGQGRKLNPKKVAEIKALLDPANGRKMMVKEIAAKYKVAQMQIYRIQNGDLWAEVPGYTKPKDGIPAVRRNQSRKVSH